MPRYKRYKKGDYLSDRDLNNVRDDLRGLRNNLIFGTIAGSLSAPAGTLVKDFRYFEAQEDLIPQSGSPITIDAKIIKWDGSDFVSSGDDQTIVDFFNIPCFENDRILAAKIREGHEGWIFWPFYSPKLYGILTEDINPCSSGQLRRFKSSTDTGINYTVKNRYDWSLLQDMYVSCEWDKDAFEWVIHAADCVETCFGEITSSEGI